MKLKEFIVTDAIVADLQSTTRDDALRELVASLAKTGAVPEASTEELVAALIKREKNGSTGFGKGVAVPHVKHSAVSKIAGVIGRSENGLDFSALDGQPVYSVFLLVSPDNQPEQHLKAMNALFGHLSRNDMFRKFLRQSDTREKITELLDEADAGK